MVEVFPGRGRHSQPTVLVSGRQQDLLQAVSLQLFGERAMPGDGVVIVTARANPERLGRKLTTNVPAFESDRIDLVDCRTGRHHPQSHPATRTDDVPTPISFVDIETSVESARLTLDERNVERRHFLFDTLTTQFRLAGVPEGVLEHAETLAMAIGIESGLTVFTVDPTVVTDHELDRLRHLFDVHLEVRSSEAEVELRWTGLIGGSDGWLPLADAGIRFDPLEPGLG